MNITETLEPAKPEIEAGVKAAAARCMVLPQVLDVLTLAHTIYSSFASMIGPEGDYRPTLRCDEGMPTEARTELFILANAYDAAREAQGDPRRAYRG